MFDHPHSSSSSHLEKSGDGFIFKPNTKCVISSDSGSLWTYFSIKIKVKNAEKVLSSSIDYDRMGCFSYNFSDKLLNLIPFLFFADRPLRDIEANFIFNDILSLQGTGQSVRENPYVEKAKAYVMRHVDRPIKITDVAVFIGISDRYLYNLFIKYEGISPKQYINNLKLEKAKKLLSSPNISVTEVAESVGFSDVLRFSHFFSDHAGLSPSKYRKTNVKK
jgi:AraC-like DNA-binding protein